MRQLPSNLSPAELVAHHNTQAMVYRVAHKTGLAICGVMVFAEIHSVLQGDTQTAAISGAIALGNLALGTYSGVQAEFHSQQEAHNQTLVDLDFEIPNGSGLE